SLGPFGAGGAVGARGLGSGSHRFSSSGRSRRYSNEATAPISSSRGATGGPQPTCPSEEAWSYMNSGRVWLAWAGHSPARLQMRPKTDMVCRVMSTRLEAIAGLRIGTVTDQKRRSGPAPSIAADSYTSLGTELSAAEYTSIE